MLTRHFLKTLVFFTTLIVLGLAGVFLVSYFDKKEVPSGTMDVINTVNPKK